VRALEAQKLGFTRCLIPGSNAERLSPELEVECIGVKSLQDVMQLLF
jgi:DNA repair protein RadA/Sms